jgi:hypothetical protein
VHEGGGSFAPAVNYLAGATPTDVALGDFNNDGRLDDAVSLLGSDGFNLLLGGNPPT